ncbi:glycosyltransferase involved in cell wall biosynthesis [Catalinimonas alkaloidigena]|uniref:glycosyltransferase family 4 protein n=1 Tax=Catalinimonas alkaloidigena TaxID=1075417 RepID=UPI002405D11E|nr:glycosyltransferase family 4 protein [Catalinimonas alkaloidigena]MDF9799689.1 glycosyltransferase involved in cell wall biosynthesis [Catalinimonas alkaloidigena]
MSKHRILFYFPFNKTLTGGPRTLITLVELLDKRKFTPVVVTQRQSLLVEELKQRNIEVVIFPLPSILDVQDGKALQYGFGKKILGFIKLVGYNRSLVQFIKKNKVRLIWSRNIKGVLFVGFAGLFTRAPLIWDIGLGDAFKGFTKLLHFIGLNLADLVITQGKSQHVDMFGQMLTHLYQRKMHYVFPGIDKDKMQLIKQLNGKQQGDHFFRIISVGSIGPRKNQEMLIEVVKHLVEKFPQLSVEFVGPVVDEAYYQRLQETVQAYGLATNIAFLGWRTDIPQLMSCADVLVLCSYNEGIPRVIHEAMHVGLPVVATRVGGVPDAVLEEESGFLVDVDDVNRMVEKLSILIQEPELVMKMGGQGKRIAQENFTYQAYYQKYDRIFSQLIDNT